MTNSNRHMRQMKEDEMILVVEEVSLEEEGETIEDTGMMKSLSAQTASETLIL